MATTCPSPAEHVWRQPLTEAPAPCACGAAEARRNAAGEVEISAEAASMARVMLDGVWIDIEASDRVPCAYCGHMVPDPAIPEPDDDAGWEAIAADHDPRCPWVITRAQRVDPEDLLPPTNPVLGVDAAPEDDVH